MRRPVRSWLHVAAAATATSLLAVACGGESVSPDSFYVPSATPSVARDGSPSDVASPTTPDSVDACELLSEQDVADLAGTSMGEPSPQVSAAGPGVSQCRWTGSAGEIVQTTSAASGVWAVALPTMIAVLEDNVSLSEQDELELDRAKEILAETPTLSDQQACELFTTIAEVGGAPAGSSQSVNYLPLGSGLALSAQRCEDGRFTSIVLARPDLEPSLSVEEAMDVALDAAHLRATGG